MLVKTRVLLMPNIILAFMQKGFGSLLSIDRAAAARFSEFVGIELSHIFPRLRRIFCFFALLNGLAVDPVGVVGRGMKRPAPPWVNGRFPCGGIRHCA
jgi:hypothetical protein